MWGRTATELAAGLRAREFSAREVMEAHLERIAAVNPRVNAIVTLLEPELALAAADAADRAPRRRAASLHGLPIAVKDLEDTAGMRTTYGSPLFADHVPDARLAAGRAAARARARSSSARRTRPSSAPARRRSTRVFGATRNPYDLTRTPGGSQRRRGGRGRRAGCCRSPTAPTSARASATRRRSATSSACGPRPGRDPGRRAGRPVEPAAGAGADRAHGRGRGAAASALGRAGPARPALARRAVRRRSAGPRRSRGLRIAWSRDLGGLPVEPEVTAVLEARRGDAGGAGLRRRGRRARLQRRRRVLRGAARRDVRRARSRRSVRRRSSRRWPGTCASGWR